MKLFGKHIEPIKPVPIPIIRPGQDEPIILVAAPVEDRMDFYKLCPPPKPPKVFRPKIGEIENVEDPNYKKQILEWSRKLYQYVFIKSLMATEGFEWETVKLDDPETWVKHDEELRQSGITEEELTRIYDAVDEANQLNDTKVNEAREAFLSGNLSGPTQ